MLRDVLFFPKFQRTPGKILTLRLKRKNPMGIRGLYHRARYDQQHKEWLSLPATHHPHPDKECPMPKIVCPIKRGL
jgi:hypothetical protein